MKRKVKWPIMHLCMKKLMHKMNVFLTTEEKLKKKRKHKLSAWIEEEKLKAVEFKQRTMTKEEVHICEPKQGLFLGEEDDGDVEKRLVKSLMDCR